VARALNLLDVVGPSGRALKVVARAGNLPGVARCGVGLRGADRVTTEVARAVRALRGADHVTIEVVFASVSDARLRQSMRSARRWRSGVGRLLHKVSPRWLRS
jgi:hypothetical protein